MTVPPADLPGHPWLGRPQPEGERTHLDGPVENGPIQGDPPGAPPDDRPRYDDTVLDDFPGPARGSPQDAPTEPDRQGPPSNEPLAADPHLGEGYTRVGILSETARVRLTRYQDPAGADMVLKVFRTRRQDLPQVWEAWNAAAASAPLIEIRDSGLLAGAAWELMPYRPNGSLHKEQPTPLTDAELRCITRDVTAGLRALHTGSPEHPALVHRDLKPSNVLVRGYEPFQVELSDTELVQFTGGVHTRDPQIPGGTEAYMAPEADLTVHPPGDYWSLGITLAYLGTGRHPYEMRGGHFLSPEQIRRSRRERLPEIPTGLRPPFDHLVRGLVTRDSNYRFGADEVGVCLDGLLPPLPPEHLPAVEPEPDPPRAADTDDPFGSWSGTAPGADASQPGDRPPGAAGFAFDGLAHTQPETLARALAGHWTLAARTLLGRDGQDLLHWLTGADAGRGRQLATILTTLGARTVTVHRAIVETILVLDPQAPPSFYGFDVGEGHLLDLANAALGGDEAATVAINHLAQGQVLSVLAHHPGQDRLSLVASRWHESLDVAQDLLRRYLPEPPPGYDLRLAATLLAGVLDRRFAKELATRALACRQDPRTALTSWLALLAAAPAEPLAHAAALLTAQPLAQTLPVRVRPEIDAFAREYLRNALAARAAPPTRDPVRPRSAPASPVVVVVVVVVLLAHAWALVDNSVATFLTAGSATAAGAGVLAHRWRRNPATAGLLVTIAVWVAVATLAGAGLVVAAMAWQPAATSPALVMAWSGWALAILSALVATLRLRPRRLGSRRRGNRT